jgi:hypothetical protein
MVGDFDHIDPLVAQQATGAAGREDFDISLRECAGKLNDTGFV